MRRKKKTCSFSLIERAVNNVSDKYLSGGRTSSILILSAGAMLIFSVSFQIDLGKVSNLMWKCAS